MTSVLTKLGNLDTDTSAVRRPNEHEGRDPGIVYSKNSKDVGKPPEAREKSMEQILPHRLKGSHPADTLTLGVSCLQNFRTINSDIYVN